MVQTPGVSNPFQQEARGRFVSRGPPGSLNTINFRNSRMNRRPSAGRNQLTLRSHRLTLLSHRLTPRSNRLTLRSHRLMPRSNRLTLRSYTDSLPALTDSRSGPTDSLFNSVSGPTDSLSCPTDSPSLCLEMRTGLTYLLSVLTLERVRPNVPPVRHYYGVRPNDLLLNGRTGLDLASLSPGENFTGTLLRCTFSFSLQYI